MRLVPFALPEGNARSRRIFPGDAASVRLEVIPERSALWMLKGDWEMKRIAGTVGVVVVVLALVVTVNAQRPKERTGETGDLVGIYRNIGMSIVKMKNAETDVMRMILRNYHDRALEHMLAARKGDSPKENLEQAATLVGYIANEGDPSVTAVTNELKEEGHHHHTMEGEENMEYLLIDGKERQKLLDLSKRIAQMAGKSDMPSDAIDKAANELSTTLAEAMKSS